MIRKALLGVAGIVTLVGGLAATAVQAPAQPYVPGPPPADRPEILPVRPGPGWVWVRGHWAWRGRWVWVRGHWARAPRSRGVWVPGHWDRRGGGWVWVEGHWR